MKDKQKDDITDLLGDLSLSSSKSSSLHLQNEINRAGFRIFKCIVDHGCFSWNPPRKVNYQTLGSINDINEFKKYVDLSGMPPRLLSQSSLSRMTTTPKYFRSSLPPDKHENKFPFGQIYLTCLHVAVKHRGVDLSTIDFAFGGSTLGVLATCNTDSNPYVVVLVPGTNGSDGAVGGDNKQCSHRRCTILVVKNKAYIQNLSDPGMNEKLTISEHT